MWNRQEATVGDLDPQAVGFDNVIKPMFREQDRSAMRFSLDLWDYDDVRSNADAVLTRVRAGDMPCDARWPSEWIDQFRRWIDAGFPR
jgi:hypothetical protein